eukprot:c28036_g2_i1 orf=139-1659(+)
MSANDGILFPRTDFIALSDFNQFPEFEDLPKDIHLGNGTGHISTPELLVDLESKSNIPLLSLCEFNNFNSFGTIVEEEEEDVKVDPSYVLLNSQSTEETTASLMLCDSMKFERLPSSIPDLSYSRLCNGDADVDVLEELTPAVSSSSSKQVELQSFKTMITTNKPNCMTLNELGTASPLVQATSQPGNPNLDSPVVASVLQEGSLALGMMSQGIASTLPVSTSLVNFASPMESPTAQGPGTLAFISSSSSVANPSSPVHSTSQVSFPSAFSLSDKSCVTGTSSTAPLSVNDLVDGILRREADWNNSQINLPGNQLFGVVSLNDCPGLSGMHNPQRKTLGNGHGAVPSHVLEESSQVTSLQRSHSSHVLGQFTSPVHQSAYQVPRISAFPSPEGPLSGLSNLSQCNQRNLADLQGLKMRPSITSIRRVYSTGDLQGCDGMQVCYGNNSSPVVDHSNVEESCTKTGHYNPEERQMKLHRYRQKRTERNFNKKIKYACRKTLADSRPRI